MMEAARNGFVNIVEMMLDHSGVFPQPPRVLPTAAVPQTDKGSPPVPPPPPPTPTASAKVCEFNGRLTVTELPSKCTIIAAATDRPAPGEEVVFYNDGCYCFCKRSNCYQCYGEDQLQCAES